MTRGLGWIVLLAVLAACARTGPSGAAATEGKKAPARKAAGRAKSPPRAATRARVAAGYERERPEGFGSQTRGGDDGRVIMVREATEDGVRLALQQANKSGGATIRFPEGATIRLERMLPRVTAPNVTLDGNGATIDGAGLAKDVALVDVRSHDVIVRDLRLRNGYDNLRVQGDEAHDVFVSHVSSTGSRDDGVSIGYGAHDVTVQWSFLAGNTRSVFCKYGANDVTLHHLWIEKGWIRSPLLSGHMRADVRNVIVEDWGEWGSRFEDGASGNFVASLFVLSPWAARIGGKGDSALRFVDAGPVYTDRNVFRGEAKPPASDGGADAPIAAPPVLTHDVDSMEEIVRDGAGCMPRDAVDRAYIALRDGWHVGEHTPVPPPVSGPPPAPAPAPSAAPVPAISAAPR
jgi:hypothetical protein